MPPYHCELNAIELIWAKCKGYYNKHIEQGGYSDAKVLDMWNEALQSCDTIAWENCCRHTDEIIKQWYKKENIIQDIEPIMINVTAKESYGSDCNTDSNYCIIYIYIKSFSYLNSM